MNPEELSTHYDEMRRRGDEEQARDLAWEKKMHHRFFGPKIAAMFGSRLEAEQPPLKRKIYDDGGNSNPESWDDMIMQTDHPMMACGCAAQGTCSGHSGQTFDPPIPCCITHSCYEIVSSLDLSGRMAKCAYKNCHSQQPSSTNLPFFEFHGAGSPSSETMCKCGFYEQAHWPRWAANIRVVRRWYKIPRHESVITKQFHMLDDKALKQQRAESEADFFRQMKQPETEVFSAVVESIKPVASSLRCRKFEAIGPQELDEYYCGCRGWD